MIFSTYSGDTKAVKSIAVKTIAVKAIITKNRQEGNILFISIVMLTALSILGLSAMRTSMTEEKISQSVQDLHLATEAAESALRHGQRFLKNAYQRDTDSGFYKTWELDGPPPPDLSISAWNTGEAPDTSVKPYYQLSSADMQMDSGVFTSRTQQPLPKFVLEEIAVEGADLTKGHEADEIGDPRETSYFRVIGRGLGLSDQNEIMLESLIIENTK